MFCTCKVFLIIHFYSLIQDQVTRMQSESFLMAQKVYGLTTSKALNPSISTLVDGVLPWDLLDTVKDKTNVLLKKDGKKIGIHPDDFLKRFIL